MDNPRLIHKLSTELSTKKGGLSTSTFDHDFSKFNLDNVDKSVDKSNKMGIAPRRVFEARQCIFSNFDKKIFSSENQKLSTP